MNFDDQPHIYHVQIEENDEIIYRKSTQVGAASSDQPASVEFSDFPNQSGEYTLSAWADDDPETESESVIFNNFESECVGVEIRVASYETDSVDPQFKLLYTTN
mgnify:CR=1 FL=1